MSTAAPAASTATPPSEAAPALPPAAAPAPNHRPPRQPEKKIGPFAGGIGVAIWLNQVETPEGGTRVYRSLTINPRRFFDRESQQWKDAGSYSQTDLPSLIFCLTQAQAYCYTEPLPGATSGGSEEQDVPF